MATVNEFLAQSFEEDYQLGLRNAQMRLVNAYEQGSPEDRKVLDATWERFGGPIELEFLTSKEEKTITALAENMEKYVLIGEESGYVLDATVVED